MSYDCKCFTNISRSLIFMALIRLKMNEIVINLSVERTSTAHELMYSKTISKIICQYCAIRWSTYFTIFDFTIISWLVLFTRIVQWTDKYYVVSLKKNFITNSRVEFKNYVVSVAIVLLLCVITYNTIKS